MTVRVLAKWDCGCRIEQHPNKAYGDRYVLCPQHVNAKKARPEWREFVNQRGERR